MFKYLRVFRFFYFLVHIWQVEAAALGNTQKAAVKQISAAFSLYRKSENHSYPAGADSDLGRCYQTPVSGCIQSAVVKMFYGRSIIPVCRADVSVSLISNIFVLVNI